MEFFLNYVSSGQGNKVIRQEIQSPSFFLSYLSIVFRFKDVLAYIPEIFSVTGALVAVTVFKEYDPPITTHPIPTQILHPESYIDSKALWAFCERLHQFSNW